MDELEKVMKDININVTSNHPNPKINLLDVYQMLSNTNHKITKVLNHFKVNLENANNTHSINMSLLHFTKDFYQIRSILNHHLHLYNTDSLVCW